MPLFPRQHLERHFTSLCCAPGLRRQRLPDVCVAVQRTASLTRFLPRLLHALDAHHFPGVRREDAVKTVHNREEREGRRRRRGTYAIQLNTPVFRPPSTEDYTFPFPSLLFSFYSLPFLPLPTHSFLSLPLFCLLTPFQSIPFSVIPFPFLSIPFSSLSKHFHSFPYLPIPTLPFPDHCPCR